ncbi:MAG: helix-turn-helix transcriptional regulator, partial [Acidimicrobiales bacterium]
MSEGPLPLVGRDQELHDLLATQQEVAAGTGASPGGRPAGSAGRMLLLSAEAGGGKTGLVTEFIERLPAGTAVGLGGSVDLGDEAMPLLPIRIAVADLERRSAGERPGDPVAGGESEETAGPAELDHDRSMLSILDVLAAARAGSVLIIEDVHWADSATLAFLRMAGSRLPMLPLLFVVTFRSDISRRHRLRPTVGELGRLDGIGRLSLDPLTRADVAELYIRFNGEPADQLTLAQLLERTGGNPFHVIESLAAGPDAAGLPASVEDALVARLEQLPTTVLEVVRVAAVAGPITADQLAEVSGVAPDVYADALRAGAEANVLVIDGDHVSFRHALLAEAARQTVLPFEARAIHRRLAERLDELDEPPTLDNLARLARHWHLAGVAERALVAAAAAADEATARRFHAVAFVQLSTVLELWETAEEPEDTVGRPRHRVLLEAAEAAGELGRADDAVRLARQAFDAVAEHPRARAETAWRYGYILYGARQLTEARRLIATEVERVIDSPADPSYARLLVAHIGISMSTGDYRVGADCDRRIIAMVDELDDLRIRGWLASFRGVSVSAAADLRQGVQLLDEAIELLTAAGDHSFGANARLSRITVGLTIDRLDDLLERTGESLAATAEAPLSRRMALAGTHAELLHYAGRTDEAWKVFESGSARLVWRTAAERALTLATLALDGGDHETARRLALSPDLAAAAHNPPMALRADLIARRVVAVDDRDTAGRELTGCVEQADRVGRSLHGALALTYAWEWVTADSDWRSDLEAASDRILADGHHAIGRSPVAAWHSLLAAHRSNDEPTVWDQAVEVCQEASMRQDQGRALLGAATAQLAAGRRSEAAARLDRADRLADEIDSPRLAAAARDLRRRARLGTTLTADPGGAGGSAGDTVTGVADFGLTARETEVLGLLAAGRTNKESADQLFISAKTVSVHVTNLLRKLDVPHRRDAGRLARDL